MKTSSVNSFKTTLYLTEENGLYARRLLGGHTAAANRGIEQLIKFSFSVYIIEHKVRKECFIGIYDLQNVTDINYHYVHDLGGHSLGNLIRKEGPIFFNFDVIGKFSDINQAKIVQKIFRKLKMKEGYSALPSGIDLEIF